MRVFSTKDWRYTFRPHAKTYTHTHSATTSLHCAPLADLKRPPSVCLSPSRPTHTRVSRKQRLLPSSSPSSTSLPSSSWLSVGTPTTQRVNLSHLCGFLCSIVRLHDCCAHPAHSWKSSKIYINDLTNFLVYSMCIQIIQKNVPTTIRARDIHTQMYIEEHA